MTDSKRRRLVARDLPVLSYPGGWDTVSAVRSALLQLEQGSFQQAAMLAQFMTRDDRVSGVLSTRIQALLGLPVTITGPTEEDPAAKDAQKRWKKMFRKSQLSRLLRWGIMCGIGLGQLIWDRTAKSATPRLKVWHPQFITWRWDTRSYWVSTMDGQVEITPGDGQWILYTPHGDDFMAWEGAQIRALAIPWLARQFATRDWARYSEVHGLPIRAGIVPTEGQEQDKERFIEELAQLSTESIIRLPQAGGPDGAKFAVELIEAVANTWEGFDKLISHCNSAIAICLLGQNLTTEVKSGSLAASKTHERVRQDVLEWDAETLGDCLGDQAVEPWRAANYGPADEQLEASWATDPPADLTAKATSLSTLSTALVNLKTVQAPVDVEKISEEYGLPLVEGAEMPDFTEPPPAPEAPPGQGKGGSAGDSDNPVESHRVHADRMPAAMVDGQLYADELADHARIAAAKKLRPDVAALLDVVKASGSYDDIRHHLQQTYRGMHPRELAALVEKALILAELDGRLAALRAL